MNSILQIIVVGMMAAPDPTAAPTYAECAAADIIRIAFPGLIPEEDLVLLATQACPELERFLSEEGQSPEFTDSGSQYGAIADSPPQESEDGEMFPGAGESIPSGPPDWAPPEPADLEGDAVPVEGLVGPADDEVHDPEAIPWRVVAPLEPSEADTGLGTMQKEYLDLGCAENPESDVCLDSEYARSIRQELENVQVY